MLQSQQNCGAICHLHIKNTELILGYHRKTSTMGYVLRALAHFILFCFFFLYHHLVKYASMSHFTRERGEETE